MNPIGRELFRAIHEGKWLKIEYLNKKGELTRYWGGIKSLDAERHILNVDGLHLSKLTLAGLSLTISSIKSAEVVEGTYCEINQKLVDDIAEYPEKYDYLFGNAANLKILSYLEECHRLDKTPFYKEHTLVSFLDDSKPTSSMSAVWTTSSSRPATGSGRSRSNRSSWSFRTYWSAAFPQRPTRSAARS